LPLEQNGVVGLIRNGSGQPVPGGRVVFVPQADVEALAETPIDLGLAPADAAALAVDEPLEDLLDADAMETLYVSAAVGGDGQYRLQALPEGRYFVVYRPREDDAAHLPGGSACRSAVDRASLAGTQLDLRVSGTPSPQANYIGSSSCLGCHGRHRTMRSAHRLSLQVPGVRGAYQDPGAFPALDRGLAAFEDAMTLYYYDCDPNRGGEANCSVSSADPTVAEPSAIVSFEIALMRDPGIPRGQPGAYSMALFNRQGPGSASYDVALTYGGLLSRQHYLARRVDDEAGAGYFVLPVQHNAHGDNDRPSALDWAFRDYRSEQWYDFAGAALREPDHAEAFDVQCAGCHLTGMRLTGDATAGYRAHAVTDAAGDADYDGDGRREEINVGCETCHGPGSEHVETRTRGLYIVSPSLLTPERELMLCGRCHSRPLGIGGGGAQAPLSADGQMPPAGVRRSEFARVFTTRVDGEADDFHASGDAKEHHAQYSDFVRTTMYRNGSILMTCTSCHDAHGGDRHAHELLRAPDDNATCTGCHSAAQFTAPREHVTGVTGFAHDGSSEAELTCTSCHMVRTAVSGARRPALLDNIPASPAVQYFHGDIASHRFAVTSRARYAEQPVAATLGCGFCHGQDLENP
jgi:predicted CXXCH cytochrome family protein